MLRRDERGSALLEVLAALLIVSVFGVAVLDSLGATVRSARRVGNDERAMEVEHRELLRYALMSAPELEQRIGEQYIGAVRISVTRPRSTLFRVAIGDTAPGTPETLATLLYRAGAAR